MKSLKHLLTGQELTIEDLNFILKTAQQLKQAPKLFKNHLDQKKLAMIFEKPSLRTRFSFGLAIQSLGGMFIESISAQRKTELPKDLIRVLNGYCDFVMIRTHDDAVLTEMVEYANIPIINGLSALHHPCQILADLLTLKERFGQLNGLKLAYAGDGNNILHSLLLLLPPLGISVHYCCPPNHQPQSQIIEQGHQQSIFKYETPEMAVKNVNAVYTDVWVSMGFENTAGTDAFSNYQINESLMALADPQAVFMHCMPMERGQEVSSSLPDKPYSVIFQQSENRLHVQKALLLFLDSIAATQNVIPAQAGIYP